MDFTETKLGILELRGDLAELTALGETFGRTLSSAFVSAAVDGRKLSDVLRSLMLSLSRQTLTSALKPVGQLLGGLIGNIFSSSGGNILPFASGGVVSGPTLFPMSSGLGLMGEKGAEAIMPLARGSDGRLGIRAASGRSVNITMNITAADAESFKRSQSQISAALLRALERGERNL